MQSLKAYLSTLTGKAFEAGGADAGYGAVVESQRPDLGQFQCNGALAAARALKRNPREIAQGVVERLQEHPFLANLSIAGPGFINITLSDEFLADQANALLQDERLGCAPVPEPKVVVIDFGGPNVAKPMHVGHLRSAIIGECLRRLFRFQGDGVIGDIHLGDWGTQMGMLISAVAQQQPELPYFLPDYPGPFPEESPITIADLEALYPQANLRCKQDPQEMEKARQATVQLQQGHPGYRALWRHFVDVSVEALKQDFRTLDIEFDLWLGESSYDEQLPKLCDELSAQGAAQSSEGALVIPVSEAQDKTEMPPLILMKSDGGFLYATTDLATIQERVQELQADLILYVVDKRQALHFEQVFRAARKTGIAGQAMLEHLDFGTVNGTDGKPFKTRAGGVMKLKDLLAAVQREAVRELDTLRERGSYSPSENRNIAEKVSIAAIKFADLMHPRTSDYIFDIGKFSKFEGKTGPYLLYAAVRIKSILRKAKGRGVVPGPILPPTEDVEKDLMLKLCMLPDAVQLAYEKRMPHHLCEFAYDMALLFSRFYDQCHILSEADSKRQASWLGLSSLCLRELEFLLYLLGIGTLIRM